MKAVMTVPIPGQDGAFGTMTFVSAESGRRYDEQDLELAQELAQRAGFAVENARLYAKSEERAHAALVLSHVDDGVFLVDRDGIVRLWNPAAETITGISPRNIIGRPVHEAISSWAAVEPLIPIGETPGAGENPVQAVPSGGWRPARSGSPSPASASRKGQSTPSGTSPPSAASTR